MPRSCHDMCALMTDVPSRGVSAVLTDVQSCCRGVVVHGVSSCAAAAGRREPGRPGWTVTRHTAPHGGAAGRHRLFKNRIRSPGQTARPPPRRSKTAWSLSRCRPTCDRSLRAVATSRKSSHIDPAPPGARTEPGVGPPRPASGPCRVRPCARRHDRDIPTYASVTDGCGHRVRDEISHTRTARASRLDADRAHLESSHLFLGPTTRELC